MSKNLTKRQAQILQRIASGETQHEIARSIGLSRDTIKNHVTVILKKLKAKSSAQAVAIAIRKGWIY